jgi:hypothetical protein
MLRLILAWLNRRSFSITITFSTDSGEPALEVRDAFSGAVLYPEPEAGPEDRKMGFQA